jgi:hypothetical protein
MDAFVSAGGKCNATFIGSTTTAAISANNGGTFFTDNISWMAIGK